MGLDRRNRQQRAEGGQKFIRADVVNWQSLVENNGYHGLREQGLLKLEGKEVRRERR